jgi:hypothetical protein
VKRKVEWGQWEVVMVLRRHVLQCRSWCCAGRDARWLTCSACTTWRSHDRCVTWKRACAVICLVWCKYVRKHFRVVLSSRVWCDVVNSMHLLTTVTTVLRHAAGRGHCVQAAAVTLEA